MENPPVVLIISHGEIHQDFHITEVLAGSFKLVPASYLSDQP